MDIVFTNVTNTMGVTTVVRHPEPEITATPGSVAGKAPEILVAQNLPFLVVELDVVHVLAGAHLTLPSQVKVVAESLAGVGMQLLVVADLMRPVPITRVGEDAGEVLVIKKFLDCGILWLGNFHSNWVPQVDISRE